MSVNISVSLSISGHLYARQSVRLSVRQSVRPYIRQSLRLYVRPSVVCPSFRPLVSKSLRPSVRPYRPTVSTSVSTNLSVCIVSYTHTDGRTDGPMDEVTILSTFP